MNLPDRSDNGAVFEELDQSSLRVKVQQAFGLATTGGLVHATGVAGLTLAGGHGFLMRKYGLACDNLLSVDVVTADGRLVSASVDENPDLFWGVRGGGGDFGIVTALEYRLHAVGPVLGGLLIYPMNQAQNLLKFYHEFTASAPDKLGALAALATLPDGTKAVVTLLCYCGAVDQGERLLQPLRTIVAPLADQVAVMAYTALQSIVENFNPRGFRNYWKTLFLKDLSDDAINIILERYARVPAPHIHLVLYTLGGAVRRVATNETAVECRDARHVLIIIGMCTDAAEDDRNINWVREFWEAMLPFASGGFYVNYETETATEKVKAAYGPIKYERLATLKAKYDPTNLFRLNQNILPARV
jgi:FAD/FMN-containing dehydrogenase